MGAQVLLPYLSFAIAAVACLISGYVALRAGKWRETDEAKSLIKRVGIIEVRVSDHTQRFEGVATKADMARVEAKVEGLGHTIDKTERGVERIEGFLMEKAR